MFNKSVPPMCLYCRRSSPLSDELFCLCERRGVVSYDFHCKKYRYNPLKRSPTRAPRVGKAFSAEDFTIE